MVLAPVAGCGVHTTGTGIQGHMGSQDNQGVTLIQRMQAAFVFKDFRADFPDDGIFCNAEGLHTDFDQFSRQNIHLTVTDIHSHIFKIGMKCDREICRKRPRGSCPDNDKNVFAFQHRQFVA